MVRGLALAALLLGACAQVLGLDPPEAAGGSSSGSSDAGSGSGVGSGAGSGSGSRCDGVVFNSVCYELVSDDVAFGQAIDMRKGIAGKLAKIDSAMLESVLADMVPLSKEVFLGATDTAQPGMFRWLDGTPLSFTAWLPSQPDGMSTEHCLAIQNAGQIGWEDVPCSDTLEFFCAYPM